MDLICESIKTARKTKVVCTLGPSCWTDEVLTKMTAGGMNIARFNFSHGSHQDHQLVSACSLVHFHLVCFLSYHDLLRAAEYYQVLLRSRTH